MPPHDPVPGTAREWLDRAKGKLALARQPLPPGAFWEDLCFLDHQAAELAIKAVFIVHGWSFPFIHDLGDLLERLERQGLSIPQEIQEADQLSPYAVRAHYPGVSVPATQAQFQEALKIAEAVGAWAQSYLP
jgi:HEPN domain-containing protein